jgi:regulatory protein
MRVFACQLLARREYSLAELAARLNKKWPSAEGVAGLVDQLAAENLVSDERFADSFVRSRIQRLQGPLKIRAELRGRGVDDSLISLALEDSSFSWSELAVEWLHRQAAGELGLKEKQKYYRRLVSRGFSHGQAMDAVNRSGDRDSV